MLGANELYPYSVSVKRESVVNSGALTTLPVRIHRHNHLADAGSFCLANYWRRIMKDGQELKSNGAPSIVGNWASFIWPESDPKRLGLLTFLLDAGCFHDDACEEMPIATAHEEHLDMADAMNIEDERVLSSSSRLMKMKQLICRAILECMEIDREGALRMVEAYRKKWLGIMETYNTDEIHQADEYLLARANNGGMGAYYAMLEFSLGIIITDEEYALMAEQIRHVERCMLLTNDYWSWRREREQARHQDAGKVFNMVWFLMRNEQRDEDDAISKVRDMIHEEERAWVDSKARLYSQWPDLRPEVIKFLENLHTALAGNDYWASQCYRHNDWRHVPEIPATGVPEVYELAALGKSLSTDFGSFNSDENDGSEFGQSSKPTTASLQSGTGNTSVTPRSDCFTPHLTPPDQHADQQVPVTEPAKYIGRLPSKNLRVQLIDSFNLWLVVPQPCLLVIKKVIDCLHHSSLILDDIQDGSDIRRGSPAVHVVYGIGQAINSATHLYVQAVESLHYLAECEGRHVMMEVFIRQLNRLFIGQGWDLYWSHNRYCPTEQQYLEMVDQKTGAMLQMLLELMQAAAPQQQGRTGEELATGARLLSEFTQLFGRFFQVRDDYMNLASEEYGRQKGSLSDFDEAKFSYMLVHMYQRFPEARDKAEGIFKSISRGNFSSEGNVRVGKKLVLSLLGETGVIAATLMMLREWHGELLEKLGITTMDNNKTDNNNSDESNEATKPTADQASQQISNALTTTNVEVNDDVWSIWSARGKNAIVFAGSFASMFSPLSSNIYLPALGPIAHDLDVSDALVNISISTYIILEGIAPTFTAQLSDTGGRRPVYLVCMVFFVAANVGLAIQSDYAALLGLRCLQSAGSSGVRALSNAVVADISTPAERGSYVSFQAAAPMFATAFGPVMGGLMARFSGWHSIFWLLAALGAAVLVPMAAFFPETCRKVVGNGSVPPPKWNKCCTNIWYERRGKHQSHPEPLKLDVRFPNPMGPVKLLVRRESGWALLYSSILACSFYSILALIPSQFGQIYNFDALQISCCYVPFGVGALVAAFSRGRMIDANFERHAARLGIVVEKNRETDLTGFPIERARLEVAVPTIVLTTACIVAFGWMLQGQVHVAGPLVLLFFVGFCAAASLNCIAALLLDVNPTRAGTVTASNNLLRCTLGAGVTAATVPMINAVGIGWTLTIFGGLNAVFMPLLWYIMREGPKWRAEEKYG
ncbi:hypothetical protein PpBr36_06851 [Pyricularia pennisetigena]|uniref:hypothetical protein n=1 Tax=Pyricularia pennisetigena TaxID=1578925 RepID=UPI00115342ED|nr:hypothetical protein PpBr36_06851 [Pyricularia pennisetigena]TLS25455.1 hypothetical protein PpBr36_06851 [Pyricularia pennisetigena]